MFEDIHSAFGGELNFNGDVKYRDGVQLSRSFAPFGNQWQVKSHRAGDPMYWGLLSELEALKVQT